ncbi:MAG TPA: hypothetical protein VIJ94_04180 [Caulobacteraceae bacterium]
MIVREEIPTDAAEIRAIHMAAFPGPAEAALVDRLRSDGDAVISLVTLFEGVPVGHVLFSKMVAPLPRARPRARGRIASFRGVVLAIGSSSAVSSLPPRQAGRAFSSWATRSFIDDLAFGEGPRFGSARRIRGWASWGFR